MLFQQIISPLNFSQWLRHDSENKRLLKIAVGTIIISFVVLKILYPFPNFMPPDSNYYLDAAYNNQFINIWPIGYSKFLRLFTSFTKSTTALVWFQYLLLEASLLYFLFSIRYLTSPGIWTFRIVLMCSVLNPLLHQISNFVSSDALFTTLSLIWFTQLIWIICNPSLKLLLGHAFILFFVFTVRYNAIYFPLISIMVIVFTNATIKIKTLGIGAIILLLSIFIAHTEEVYKKQTGTKQYSAFGGWQLAANALYGYAFSSLDSLNAVPEKYRSLHKVVNRHMTTLKHLPDLTRPDLHVGVYYLWDYKSPLKIYMSRLYKKDSTTPYLKQWASVGPLYASYGRYIILHHPWSFIKYYVGPNFINYCVPPTGFMGFYNVGMDHVAPIVVKSFGWKNNKVSTYSNDRKIDIVNIFPKILAVINLIFLVSLLSFFLLGGNRQCASHNKRILYCLVTIWLSNMIFSVLSAPIELRYQLFQMIITFCFSYFLVSYIIVQTRLQKSDIIRDNKNKFSFSESK